MPPKALLQDIHWSQGSCGYPMRWAGAFETVYYYHMKKEMDFEGLLEKGRSGNPLNIYRRPSFCKLKDQREIHRKGYDRRRDFNRNITFRYLKENTAAYTFIEIFS